MKAALAGDDFGAYCPYAPFAFEPTGRGALDGLDFAAKDLFDVAGVPTGAGSPEWLETHPVPDKTASALATLLAAGARLVAKTRTDELAFSLSGDNARFGAPTNPAAPCRLPGGSSSGSAVAAAARLVDFAIGSDTGGSVRLPASFCGVYGIRPTHGRIPLDNVVPLAPSFDTVGWFSADATVLERVGSVYFPEDPVEARMETLIVAQDAFDLAGETACAALEPALDHISARFGEIRRMRAAPDGLETWRETFRILQGQEAWAAHGAWITATRPALGADVAARFRFASTIGPDMAEPAARRRDAVRARMNALLADGAILCVPSAPGPAPFRGSPLADVEVFRARALSILSIAGLAGLPQASLPLARLDDAPLGLSLIAAAGRDRALLSIVSDLAMEAAL